MNALCSWSGGKDSCFALMQAIRQGYRPKILLNVLNEQGKISRSHGIPSAILAAQAAAASLPIHLISSSWNEYEIKFTHALQELSSQYHLTHAVFGDIDLQPHRDWEEKVCIDSGLTAILPLWQQDRKKLVIQMLEEGIVTMIVSCNKIMGEKFLGRILSIEIIEELEALGIDPCGENGEFHTLVLDCPLFNHPIKVDVLKKIVHEDFYFTELALSE
ncbi:MAG: diphthine--ammonia ligase [Bacteroidota bacterium]|nr:diphthine--ammonia ligase [Bacteroidota bacterium]